MVNFIIYSIAVLILASNWKVSGSSLPAVKISYKFVKFVLDQYEIDYREEITTVMKNLEVHATENREKLGEILHQQSRTPPSELSNSYRNFESLYRKILFDTFLINHFESESRSYAVDGAKESEVKEVVDRITQSGAGITETLISLYTNLAGSPKDSGTPTQTPTCLLNCYRQYLQLFDNFTEMCDKHFTAQQYYSTLAVLIGDAEIQAFSTFEKSLNMLFDKDEVSERMRSFEEQIRPFETYTARLFDHNYRQLSRDVWTCDPKKIEGKDGEAYLNLKTVQKFLVTEEDISTKPVCTQECDNADVKQTKCVANRPGKLYNSLCEHPKQNCLGTVTDCQRKDENLHKLYFCYAGDDSYRRFTKLINVVKGFPGFREYLINGQNKSSYCLPGDAPAREFFLSTSPCALCMCDCQSTPDSGGKYVSVAPVVADSGKIITGARFALVDDTLVIKIQQGTLVSSISVKDNKWKDVDPESLKVEGTRQFISPTHRTFQLGLVEVPNNSFITGLQIKVYTRDNGEEVFGLKVTSKEYDRTNNSLTEESEIYSRPTIPHNEKEVNQSDDDVPTSNPKTADTIINDQMYVKIQTTNVEKDVGQTTIPFVDLQPVALQKSLPLTGIGFYLKKSKGYGGYLSIKLITVGLNVMKT